MATYPKAGTTWMQQIVGLLIFQDPTPRAITPVSPWIDGRHYGDVRPIYAEFDKQVHRRFAKSHLPADGLPIYDEVKYIHVVRDGRDVAMSLHNQWTGFADRHRANFSRIGLDDETLDKPFPSIPDSEADLYRYWISRSEIAGQDEGGIGLSFFDFELTYWKERSLPNLLMVHFNDLIADLDTEMRRVAAFLGVDVDERIWGTLVRAAQFSEMRDAADLLLPEMNGTRKHGARGFFFKGSNGRWRDLLDANDVAAYDAKVQAKFSPNLAAWVEYGRRAAGIAQEIRE
ncbi:MAG: sulfotransferase domain-containing protein [Pirellulaceae bacterium]